MITTYKYPTYLHRKKVKYAVLYNQYICWHDNDDQIFIVKIIFILPRTTGHIPVVWVRLVAYTKLRHPREGTRQGFCLIYKLIEVTTK